MRTLLRVTLGFMVVGLVVSVTALIMGVGRPEPWSPLRFDPDPFVVLIVPDRTGEGDYEVDVVNDAAEPARLVGSEDYCAFACLSGISLPVDIPARGRARVKIHLGMNNPGPFSQTLNFLTDRPSQPKLAMRVEGLLPEGTPRGLTIPTSHR